MSNNYSQFTDEIYTKGDLNKKLAQLSEVGSYYYDGKSVSKNEGSLATKLILEKINKIPHLPDKEGYIRELSEYLKKLPIVTIELAFEPTIEFIKRISYYINEATEQKIVLDIKVKPEIIAGITVEKNGMFKDYSYKEKLEEVLGSYETV